MILTNKQIEDIFAGLLNIQKPRFPAKVSYAIVRNKKILEPIYEDIMTTRRITLEKYGTPYEEDPNRYRVDDPEDIKKASKELEEINNTEVEVILQKINFSDIENLDLSVEEMDALFFMVNEE